MAVITSRTVRFHEFGEPLDVLREEEFQIADPPAGHVRVRVVAVGLNPADWELCRGFLAGSLPRGIGLDVAGVVDAVGVDVTGVEIGDLVFGVPDFIGQPSAGVADLVIMQNWAAVPDGLDPIKASVLPMPVQIATSTLEAMEVQPGATVLVHGAGATVGFAAVQVARRMGARVIATAGSTYSDVLSGFGVAVTSYGAGMVDRVKELADGPIDLVFDAPPPNAGSLPSLIELVGDPEKVVTISNHDEARRLGARVNLDIITNPRPFEQVLPEYAALVAAGEFVMPIARTFAFDDWREAVRLSLSGRARGKLVLLPGDHNAAREQ